MRSIWNGAVSFGLVSIPVKLINATENHAVSFRQVHLEDGGRIRYRKVCELEDKEVEPAEIGKGYEDADGSVIPITEDDLKALPAHTAKTIEIVAFVPADSVDPLQMDTAYYLSANGVHAAKPYTLLREALRQSRKVAIAKFALRGRERLGMLRVADDVIALHGLLWPDEIRSPQEVAPDTHVTVRDAELDLADALMDTLGEVDMDSLHDDYRAAVEELAAAKATGEPAPAPAPEPGGGKVIDLMAALENSVRAAKAAQGDDADGEDADGDDADEEVAEVTHLAGRSRKKSAPAKKTTPAKTSAPAKKTTGAKEAASARKSPPASSGRSTDAKSTSAKSAGTKSTSAKSTSAKSAGTKSAGTKSTAKKTAAKKTPTKKVGADKKTAAKKTAAKKTAAKKPAAKKTAAKKAPARKKASA